jgi:hypothetical protein
MNKKSTSGFVRRGRALVFSSGCAGVLDNKIVNSILKKERGRVNIRFANEFSLRKRR